MEPQSDYISIPSPLCVTRLPLRGLLPFSRMLVPFEDPLVSYLVCVFGWVSELQATSPKVKKILLHLRPHHPRTGGLSSSLTALQETVAQPMAQAGHSILLLSSPHCFWDYKVGRTHRSSDLNQSPTTREPEADDL